jgi:predicted NAD/FAD-binding protein
VVLFLYPTSLAKDSSGNLYVADASSNTIQKVTSGGVVTTFAGMAGVAGATDANGSNARFNQPNGVAVDGGGSVYVADTGNATIRKVATDGTVTTLAGTTANRGNRDGTGTGAWFNSPTGISVDGAGNLYVADAFTNTIRKITSGGAVTTLAGNPAATGWTDGTGTAALFHYPTGTAVDSAGNVYVADAYNNNIRKITSAGVVTTMAGNYQIGGAIDGSGSLALFNQPVGLTVDSAGSIYVADTVNCTIRKVSSTGVVTTIAGIAGIAGLRDGAGSTALFNQPRGVILDGSGGLYVADTGNAAVRRISTDSSVSTPVMTQPATTTTTTTTTTGSTSSSGGGGAMEAWFVGILVLLGSTRWMARKN